MSEDVDKSTEPKTGELVDDRNAASPDFGLLSRVKVGLTVEVGQTQLTLRDLIRLGEGSVVELDRMAGDPLDILANGVRIAKGEVVVVGDKFGIRLSEIVDARRRVEQL